MPPAGGHPTTREGLFPSTRWTIVVKAGDDKTSSRASLDALSELCQIYWQPLYLFLRREGYAREDAQDLTQGFFADLIETRAYARADQQKGRFRSFLLGALKHFAADRYDHDWAQKRGGGVIPLPLNEMTMAEVEAQLGNAGAWNADHVYEREWAAALLRQVLDRLAKESALAGKSALFENLKSYLSATQNEKTVPYKELSLRLGRPVATLRSDVARLRARYRAILREEVRGTVIESTEVDEELRYLCQVLAA